MLKFVSVFLWLENECRSTFVEENIVALKELKGFLHPRVLPWSFDQKSQVFYVCLLSVSGIFLSLYLFQVHGKSNSLCFIKSFLKIYVIKQTRMWVWAFNNGSDKANVNRVGLPKIYMVSELVG